MKQFICLIIVLISFIAYSSQIEAATKELELKFNEKIAVDDAVTPYAYHFTVHEEGRLTIEADYVDAFYQVNLRARESEEDLDNFSHFDKTKKVTYGLKPGDYTIYIVSLEDSFAFQFSAQFQARKEPDAHPNATMAQAYHLGPNEVVDGHHYHYTPSNDRADFYQIEVPAGKMVVATLKSDQNQLSMLKLLDANGQMLEYARQNERGQTLLIDLPIAQSTYYFTVQANGYEFSYKLVDRPPFVEIEGNNTFETATPVVLNEPYTADVNDKEDFYQFTLKENQFVEFVLTSAAKKPNFSFQLYTQNKKKIVHERNQGATSMHLKAGTYTVQLTDDRINQGPYTFEVKTSSPADNASMEPNNTFEEAQQVPLNSIITTTGSSQTVLKNMYKIELTKPGVLTLKNDRPTSDYGLYNANQQLIETYGTMTLKKIALKPGTYYIQDASIDSNRHLKIQFTARAAEQEPNDVKAQATSLTLNDVTVGFSIDSDVNDWYKIDVPSNGDYTFKIDTIIPYGWGVKDMLITTANGSTVFQNKLGEKQKTLSLTKGTYYIQLFGGRSTSYYSLKWQPAKLVDFVDVPANYRYYKEITAMRNVDIITGYADNTFKPNAPMQRHHVAAMISRTRLEKVSKANTYLFQFPDVPLHHANYDPIHMLSDVGIVDENPNGFRPSETITRAQMAKILVNTFELQRGTGTVPQFKDVSAQAWYKEYVDILASHGITTGSKGYFNPNAPVTREHFSLFLYRSFESLK